MATSSPIGFGEVGNEMSHSFRPKTEEQKRNSPLNLIGAYLLGKIQDSISPPGSLQTSGVDLNNDAYFKANPVSAYGQEKPIIPSVNVRIPIAPPELNMNPNEEPKPIHVGPTHFGPTHFGPRTPDPAHLQIDSDWGK
jgi:hypothetical protein